MDARGGAPATHRGDRSAAEAGRLEDRIDAMVVVATALNWATLSAGDEQRSVIAIDIIRLIVETNLGASEP